MNIHQSKVEVLKMESSRLSFGLDNFVDACLIAVKKVLPRERRESQILLSTGGRLATASLSVSCGFEQ